MYLKEYTNKEKIIEILNVLINKGCNKESAASLLTNNLGLISYTKEELESKLSMIYNNREIYAILFCDENNYKWSLYNKNNNSFTVFKGYNEENSIFYGNVKEQNKDYIVEMVLSYLDNPKFKNFIKYDETDTLEEKINNYKSLKTNDQGYHIK